MSSRDRVADLFKDRTIFVTGGSGFMGKVLLEKILRTTEIKKIILLIRGKKEVEPRERFEELVKDVAFDRLKRQMTIEEIYSKLDFVSGDCGKLNLGLSIEDRMKITENATIFYHFAATVRFDEKMKTAVETNVRGTREIIKLALECKKLEMFGHMSTCFCHVHEEVLYEKPYDPPFDPHETIEMCSRMSDEDLEDYSKKLLKQLKFPNAYSFTKSLAEALVVEAKLNQNLPAIIFRPSIVVVTWRDPMPGYIDNVNGPVGLILAIGKGVARSIYMDGDNIITIIPCDVAIDGVLVGTWNYLENECEVFFKVKRF